MYKNYVNINLWNNFYDKSKFLYFLKFIKEFVMNVIHMSAWISYDLTFLSIICYVISK